MVSESNAASVLSSLSKLKPLPVGKQNTPLGHQSSKGKLSCSARPRSPDIDENELGSGIRRSPIPNEFNITCIKNCCFAGSLAEDDIAGGRSEKGYNDGRIGKSQLDWSARLLLIGQP